ncbi:MAG: hypothetical protein P9L94_16535 [Candidatus Hinthialibacter antarcticus]|nr:hypothetical protein [Candidatus Hinthialibacter antarcticus]
MATLQEIESEMEELQMLMKIWNQFYKVLNTTFAEEKADQKALDREFQRIKQIVAEHHGHFMKVIKKDFHIGQSVMTTVKRTISIDGFLGLSDLEIRKTLIEWHDANILLNETLGSLECERDRINRGLAQKDKKKLNKSDTSFFQSGTFKLLLNVIVIAAVIGALVVFWEPISQSSIYQGYLAWMIDPILNMIGITTTTPEAAAPAG